VSATLSFGAWLRQRRRTLGLSHAALADAVRCSVSALRKIEQDERRPSFGLAERLAASLQIADCERARFLEIARGERRIAGLDGVAPVAPAPLPGPEPESGGASAPLRRLLAPFDPSMPSIAVLPFANMCDDAANEHFADGLAEELLNVLAKIPGLRVASRTSAFSFKGKLVDIPTIAKKLNVSSILEGSVRRAGQRVRINAQLVEVATDSHLWSQAYDRDLADILAVQDDIAQSVVRELRVALLGEGADAAADARVKADVVAASRGRTDNAQAHQLYLKGRFLVDRHTSDDTATAIGYCRQALELDPDYALAWAGLATAYANQAGWGWAPLDETFERARDAAQRALQREPDLAEAHAELGWIRMTYDWDWRGAEEAYRRAVALGSGNRSILVGASLLADNLGRSADAVALARRAVAIDPLCFIAQGNLALRCFNAGLLDEAAAAVEAALAISPRGALMHWLLGTIRLEQGRLDAALGAFKREEHDRLRVQGLALVHHAAGRSKDAKAALDELIRDGADDSAFQIAEALACRGDVDGAFEWLERARVQRDPGVSQIRSGPLLRNLHDDPRWRPFLEKMGFAPAVDAPARDAG
jgi:TolB-like protein/Tfp pilus assembly protein PilF/DNA-binding XRE family transcriptional regulator